MAVALLLPAVGMASEPVSLPGWLRYDCTFEYRPAAHV
eukprot:COSAG04_NODE_902_length_9536_cov_20.105447_1_plen_38_part_00